LQIGQFRHQHRLSPAGGNPFVSLDVFKQMDHASGREPAAKAPLRIQRQALVSFLGHPVIALPVPGLSIRTSVSSALMTTLVYEIYLAVNGESIDPEDIIRRDEGGCLSEMFEGGGKRRPEARGCRSAR
jgi:hypothetical protein